MSLSENIDKKSFFYLKYSNAMLTLLNEFFLTPNYEFYATQFLRNFELVLKKHKKYLLPTLNVAHLGRTIKQRKGNEIYVFLCLLSKYEVDIGKMHSKFTTDDWMVFSNRVLFSDFEEIMFLNEFVFKQNFKNFHWTLQEDDLLQRTILLLQQNCGKIKWKAVASQFNEASFISQMRTPHHCKERWENTLQRQFKKGDWKLEEDRKILEFVIQYGPRWALISKTLLQNRTEHNIKNRFFSLVATFSGVPVKRVIKERKKYIDEEYVKQVLMFNITENEMRIQEFNKQRQNEEGGFFQVKNGCQFFQNEQLVTNYIGNGTECFGLFINFLDGTL